MNRQEMIEACVGLDFCSRDTYRKICKDNPDTPSETQLKKEFGSFGLFFTEIKAQRSGFVSPIRKRIHANITDEMIDVCKLLNFKTIDEYNEVRKSNPEIPTLELIREQFGTFKSFARVVNGIDIDDEQNTVAKKIIGVDEIIDTCKSLDFSTRDKYKELCKNNPKLLSVHQLLKQFGTFSDFMKAIRKSREIEYYKNNPAGENAISLEVSSEVKRYNDERNKKFSSEGKPDTSPQLPEIPLLEKPKLIPEPKKELGAVIDKSTMAESKFKLKPYGEFVPTEELIITCANLGFVTRDEYRKLCKENAELPSVSLLIVEFGSFGEFKKEINRYKSWDASVEGEYWLITKSAIKKWNAQKEEARAQMLGRSLLVKKVDGYYETGNVKRP